MSNLALEGRAQPLEDSGTHARPASQADLLGEVQRQVDTLLRHGLTSATDAALTPKWADHAGTGWAALVAADGRLKPDAIRNFRRNPVLVRDLPAVDLGRKPLRNRLIGWRRGTRHCLMQCFDILVARGFDDLLRKYPCDRAGNPHVFRHGGCEYTFAWARHVYELGLLKTFLIGDLGEAPVVLDIGCSFGIFSSLVRREYPRSRHVLVDLPEQLLLAFYFLRCCFPAARIAGPGDVAALPAVTPDFIRSHDFVLIPSSACDRLAPGAVDLVTNFGSFGEMSRQYFETYLDSPAVLSARYLLTINRVAAVPERYHNDITILDYPIWEAGKRLHFDVCPIYSVDFLFTGRAILWHAVTAPDPHFEYAGRI
jgi:putative sugar O-methyltransferase